MGICFRICTSCVGDFYEWLCRLWGIVTAVGLWGVGVEAAFYGHYLGFYLLAVAFLCTLLEAVFAINYFVELCFSIDTRIRSCWQCILWLDNWKKSILYLALSIPCFIQPVNVWIAVIGGIMLVLCGLLYALKTCKTKADKERKTLAQTPSYDKFEEIQEDLDDGDEDDHVISHPGTISIMESDIGDQTEILEV